MWEYLSRTFNLAQEPSNAPDHALNELGERGWELVLAEFDQHRLFCIFKRPARGRE